MSEKEIELYLDKFNHARNLSIVDLWEEMDRVWNYLNLDNSSAIGTQKNIGEFYGHPVWILNGIFSSTDPESIAHRESIGDYLSSLSGSATFRVADIGGGSGVLAQTISSKLGKDATVEIIEPYPSEYFIKKNQFNKSVSYKKTGDLEIYDVATIQDVLEHVDDPINMSFETLSLLKKGGYAIFASCFYPVILCHLPSTFYLRHTFKYLFNIPGLSYVGQVPGVPHALVFKKNGEIQLSDLLRRARVAKVFGTLLNCFQKIKNKLQK
jgi:2-polyprenyl-3-methyl-5-hydroxy-6-metoxy-1,4-benzoquinol methylase